MYPDMFPKTITILKYHCRVRAVYVNRNKVQHVFGIPDIWIYMHSVRSSDSEP